MAATMRGTATAAAEKDKTFLRRHPSVLLLCLSLAIATAMIFWINDLERSRLKRLYEQQLTVAESQLTRVSLGLIGQIKRDSLTLDKQLSLSGVLSSGHSFDREKVEELFRGYIQDHPLISQIRWLDSSGMERARIDRRVTASGRFEFPAAEILQDKSHRDYFKQASRLNPGEFYNSYIGLNREFGAITLPPQPVIRTATKTHPMLGMHNGVLFINFDLSHHNEEIRQIAQFTGISIDMLDARDGRLYVSTHHPELALRHELDVSAETLWDRFPERRTTHLEFAASKTPSLRSPYNFLIKGPGIIAGDGVDMDDQIPQVWSRGGRLVMSAGGLIFDLRVPASRIAGDLRTANVFLCIFLMITLSLIGLFAVMGFRLERKNIVALDEAKNLAAIKSQFLANMSHEIRTPVTGVIGMLDLIEADTESPENRKKIEFVKHSTNSLKQIIDDILDITKLQNSRIKLNPVPFKPVDTLGRVIQLYSASAEGKGIELTASPSSEIADVVVRGDEFRIEQVLNNLVSNAIKFTETGKVKVGLAINPPEENRVRLFFTVADTGMGIKPELIEHLGEPFFQADLSNTRKFGGTGLGLSICKSLLTLMDSTLDIATTSGEGTTMRFAIELPLVEAEQIPQVGEDLEQGQSLNDEPSREEMQETLKARVQLHGPPGILVVEDSISMQLLIEAIFQSLDIPVTLAEHGKAAVQLVDHQEFDLVFMDLQMPEMGGVEATRQIRAKLGPEVLPIIILSATVQDEEIQKGLAAGANGYLGKPIEMEELLAALLQFWQPPASPA